MARKPNLIVVLIDDLRFDETCASGHPFMKTPNIDRLARSPPGHGRDVRSGKDPCELNNLASDPAAAKEREAVKKELRKLTAEALGI